MIIVVAYDICSDRRRTKMEKLLKDYGQRVNYSVFECDIEKAFYPELKKRTRAIIDKKEDRVLFYPLCLECLKKRNHEGKTVPAIPERLINL